MGGRSITSIEDAPLLTAVLCIVMPVDAAGSNAGWLCAWPIETGSWAREGERSAALHRRGVYLHSVTDRQWQHAAPAPGLGERQHHPDEPVADGRTPGAACDAPRMAASAGRGAGIERRLEEEAPEWRA